MDARKVFFRLNGSNIMFLPPKPKTIFIPLELRVIKLTLPEDLTTNEDILEFPEDYRKRALSLREKIISGELGKEEAVEFARSVREIVSWMAINHMIHFDITNFNDDDDFLHNCLVIARYSRILENTIRVGFNPPEKVRDLLRALESAGLGQLLARRQEQKIMRKKRE